MNLVIVAIVMLWTGLAYMAGYNVRDNKAIAEVSEQQKQDMAAFKQLEVRYNAQSDQLTKLTLESQNETQVITKYVDRIVDRPIYRNDCFDDDGLRLANAALLGRAALAVKPDAAVSTVGSSH